MLLKNVLVNRKVVLVKHKVVGLGIKHHTRHHAHHRHSHHRGMGVPPQLLVSHSNPTIIRGLGVRGMEHKLKRRPIKFMP